MAIKDFIVPRWKHSNPKVRIQAVRTLSPDMLDILKQIVENDPDPRVRIEAIHQLTDIPFLKHIVSTDNDIETRQSATSKLNSCYADQIHSTSDPSLQGALILQIDDEKILAHIASDAERPEIRLLAIDRIDNPHLLCQIAEKNCGLKPGKAIVNKLSNPKHLELISKNASNKKIKKYARDKLTNLWESMDAMSPEKQLEWELEELCLSLEQVVATEKWADSSALLTHLQKQWDKIDPDNTHPLKRRFNQTRRKIEEQLDQIDRKQDTVTQMTELCKKLEVLVEESQQTSILSNTPDNLSYYEKKVESIKERWEHAELSVQDGIIPFSVYHNLSSRYSRSIEQLDRFILDRTAAHETYQSCIKNLETTCQELEQLDALDDKETVKKLNDLKNKWADILKKMPCGLPVT
ncbi:MAG: HEAT repeat domain-containing protein, partial [Candidatus Magnetomorum sp.]|nr:HEAT repeat domain-containing protein [Candidatus Magnetomorum sp.]